MEKPIHFQTLDLTKFLTCSVGLNMVTISDKTHIKTIYSLSSGICKYFIGNALCSSDDSVTHLIHILDFATVNYAFYKPPEEKYRKVKSGERGNQGMGLPLRIQRSGNFLSRKAPTQPEKWGGVASDWKTVPTGIWREAVFSIRAGKVSPVTVLSSKKKRPVTLFLIEAHHTFSFGESRSCSVTSLGFSLPHTRQLRLLTLPRTWNVASSEAKWDGTELTPWHAPR